MLISSLDHYPNFFVTAPYPQGTQHQHLRHHSVDPQEILSFQIQQIVQRIIHSIQNRRGSITATHVEVDGKKYEIDEIASVVRSFLIESGGLPNWEGEVQLNGRTFYCKNGQEFQIFDLTAFQNLEQLKKQRAALVLSGNDLAVNRLSSQITQLERSILLGRGKMGAVYRIPSIHTASLQALKCADPQLPPEQLKNRNPQQENLREGQLLTEINGNGDAIGIQIPSAVLEKRNAYVTPIYTMSLYVFIQSTKSYNQQVPLKHKLDACLQLLSGFSRLSQLSIFHLDTKPDNILVKVGVNQNVYHLSDFGGDRSVNDLLETALALDNPLGGMSCTLSYIPEQDVEKLRKHFFNAKKAARFAPQNFQKHKELYLQQMQKIMVFVWGVTLYQLLCCDNGTPDEWPLPYKVSQTGLALPHQSLDLSRLQASRIPPQLIQCIQDMLNTEDDKRPDPVTACKHFIQTIHSL